MAVTKGKKAAVRKIDSKKDAENGKKRFVFDGGDVGKGKLSKMGKKARAELKKEVEKTWIKP